MPILAIAAGAAGGGRFIPNKPILVHGASSGQFTISNYDSSLKYTISAGSRSDNTITLGTGGTVSCTVTASPPKGGVSSAGSSCERRTITYHNEWQCWEVQYSGENLHWVDTGGGTGYWSWDCPGGTGGGGQWGVNVCRRTDCGNVPVKDAIPSGFNESYEEWWAVS